MRMPIQKTDKNSTGFFTKTIFLVVLVFFAGTGSILYLFFRGDGGSEIRDIVIARKTPLAQVAEQLHQNEIIEYPTLFKYLLRFSGGSHRVRAGEFRFKKDMRMFDALFVLYNQDPIVHQITIPEGWTARQIAKILAEHELVNEEKFVNLVLSPETAQRFHLATPSLEGFLYPDTYAFSKVDGEERVIERMVQQFFKKFGPEGQEAAKRMGMSLEQLVTLASIIEKETGALGERELISSVFHNRLKKKMRLQSDPTTIYGIPNFNGNLTREDLKAYSPYNTYVIPALPPGPIANPGIAALQAALHPAQSNYLFFVSTNQGAHVFSETYGQHASYVNNYQKRRPKRLEKNITSEEAEGMKPTPPSQFGKAGK